MAVRERGKACVCAVNKTLRMMCLSAQQMCRDVEWVEVGREEKSGKCRRRWF